MNKNYIEIKYNDKVVCVASVKSGSTTDYLNAKKEAEQNLKSLIKGYDDFFVELVKRIDDLEKEVKHLKGED